MNIRDKSDLLSAISVYIDKAGEHQKHWIRKEVYDKVEDLVYKVSPGPGSSILVEWYAGNDISKCCVSMYHIQNIIKVPIFTCFNGTYITMTGMEK